MESHARKYDARDAESIFAYSSGLIGHTLTEAVAALGLDIVTDDIQMKGKGGLGQLVEKFYYGYEPNSDPRPDFPEAGVELKTTPLKTTKEGKYAIKERLVCDMIDFCAVVDTPFEKSAFYRKSILMLILFYLHSKGKKPRDLKFFFSVLWRLKEKDLLIIKHDYETIVDKIKRGLAHELSEGDTLYLGACRKGQKGDALRKQPFSDIKAPKRAFALKTSYMRTILDFAEHSGTGMATNTEIDTSSLELVSSKDLEHNSLEDILTRRLMQFRGMDYRQIADHFGMEVSCKEKSRYARVTKRILLKGLKSFEDAEEIRKAGIIAKTIRLDKKGRIKENMSFENIDYNEIINNKEWTNSRWYEIVTSRFMFVVFREDPDTHGCEWEDEARYTLDKVVFWTMPAQDMKRAKAYWENIRQNVTSDTLQDGNNTFWKQRDGRMFHVRPKAQNSGDKCYSPKSGIEVPKKAYWFNRDYVRETIKQAYGDDWKRLFGNDNE